jgi:hypothetical protein
MNRFLRFPSLRSFTVRIAVAAIAFLLAVIPVLAADNPKAPIILDGARLFEVSQSGGYTAQERADDANRVLNQKVTATAPPISVKLDNNQTLPIIKVDGSHLLTVTEQDAPPGRTAKEQAEIWAGQLQGAIQLAQKQRSPNYISKAIVLSAGFVLLVIAFTWALG